MDNCIDFYHAAIKNVTPDAYNIRQPEIRGKIAQVFFADTGNQTNVYRFTHKYFIHRNHKISQLLAARDIPAPITTVHKYMQTEFESYPYCAGQTLFERMSDGMTDADIFAVYSDALRIQHRISQIDIRELANEDNRFFWKTYNRQVQQQLPWPVATLSTWVMFVLSRSGKMQLFHNDLNPCNILVSDDNRVSYLLDLDGINICNQTYCLTRLAYACPLDNSDALVDCYEQITGNKIHKNQFKIMLRFLRMASANRHKFEKMCNISR